MLHNFFCCCCFICLNKFSQNNEQRDSGIYTFHYKYSAISMTLFRRVKLLFVSRWFCQHPHSKFSRNPSGITVSDHSHFCLLKKILCFKEQRLWGIFLWSGDLMQQCRHKELKGWAQNREASKIKRQNVYLYTFWV